VLAPRRWAGGDAEVGVSVREVVVLGSASQVPTKHRNHNGYLVLFDGVGVLFDPGEGTQRQMTLAGLRAHQLHAVCVTHFHGDHCLGLPGIIQRISLDGVPHEVAVAYPASGQRYFERLRRASIFLDRSNLQPAPLTVNATPADTGLRVGPLAVWAARLDHAVDTVGYRLQEPPGWTLDPERLAAAGVHGPAAGALKRDGEVVVDGRRVTVEEVGTPRPGQSVAFLMDTRPCEAAEALAADADLVICESTYLHSEAREARDHGHMTADEAGRLAQAAGARRLLLTHFSQRYPLDAPFVEEAGRHHPDVHAARDLLHVALPPRSAGGAS
jgi:ribonuclease Z